MKREYAKFLLKKNRQNYNKIALHYAKTREFSWDIQQLAKYVSSSERVLDIGCGNGRLYKIFKSKNIEYIGVDNSDKLIEVAKKNYPDLDFRVADALNLPFPDNYFDKIYSIRVFHHFPSEEFRLQFLKETKRVLKPKGFLILTVWNIRWQKNRRKFLRLIKSDFFKIIGLSKLDFGDVFIPWDKKTLRYYHYFTKNELKSIVEKSGFKVKKAWDRLGSLRSPDIYIIAEK